ncbi:hypothetical protein [Streptomyces sp. 5-10]|uniref:hypothetical protein n=1 Tax=Streptomyces sp. 5-10 TaxID=878925 RepID=UPI001CC2BE55|nr:hypothetical protein [Streptomyces sp. 5-10]
MLRLAPTGYDAAVLHSHSLLTPSVAACVRRELEDVLNTPEGRYAELAVITQLLHSTTHSDNLELAKPLRHRAERLLGRAVPHPPPPLLADLLATVENTEDVLRRALRT